MTSSQREKLRRKLASAVGKEPSVSLFIFVEVNNLELEHAYLCVGVLLGTRGLDGSKGRWNERSMETAAMESNVVDKITGPAAAVLRDMKDIGIAVPRWKVLRLSDG